MPSYTVSLIKKKVMNLKQVIFLSLAIITSFFLYSFSLSYYFFQDDFYEILLSRADSLEEFFNLFKFLDFRSSYRPLGLQVYYFSQLSVFGLNPFLFRIVLFCVFFATCVLIYKTAVLLTKSKTAGVITSFMWVTSSVHFLALSWIAANWLIIGAFFFMTTSYLFLKYLESSKNIYYIFSVLTFILAILTSEFSLSWTPIFILYTQLIEKLSFKKLVVFVPFIAITAVYTAARLSFSSLPQIAEYKMVFDISALKTLSWYFVWVFNVPEEFKKQVVSNLIYFNPAFSREFWPIILKTTIGAVTIVAIAIIVPILKIIKTKNINHIKIVTFFLFWFVVSLLPVLFLKNHTFAMYLAVPSIGIYLLVSYLLASYTNKFVIALCLVVWVYSSSVTIGFYRDTSWVNESQNFARKFARDIKSKYPTLGKNEIIYYPQNDKRRIQSLSNQNAIKVLYDDTSLQIFYNQTDLDNFKMTHNLPNSQIKYFLVNY